jgi:hypothetical protein
MSRPIHLPNLLIALVQMEDGRYHDPAGAAQTKLRVRMGLAASVMSKLCGKAEQAGLIVRDPGAARSRSSCYVVQLTEAGFREGNRLALERGLIADLLPIPTGSAALSVPQPPPSESHLDIGSIPSIGSPFREVTVGAGARRRRSPSLDGKKLVAIKHGDKSRMVVLDDTLPQPRATPQVHLTASEAKKFKRLEAYLSSKGGLLSSLTGGLEEKVIERLELFNFKEASALMRHATSDRKLLWFAMGGTTYVLALPSLRTQFEEAVLQMPSRRRTATPGRKGDSMEEAGQEEAA